MWADRPTRAWCLAVRASDTRINPVTALCAPQDAAYPHEFVAPERRRPYAQHIVTLTAELLQQLCAPVRVHRLGERWYDIAKKLGRTKDALRAARILGVFRPEYWPQT